MIKTFETVSDDDMAGYTQASVVWVCAIHSLEALLHCCLFKPYDSIRKKNKDHKTMVNCF
jgi:hypothetical protein